MISVFRCAVLLLLVYMNEIVCYCVDSVQTLKGTDYSSTHENSLSLLVVPRVTNIHLSPLALMNEVTRRNKGFLRVHAATCPFLCLNRYDKGINDIPYVIL